MDHYGGAKSTNPITNLLNKIRSYSLSNPNAGVYNVAGGDLSPEFKTMTLMRFPIHWSQWRSQHEETLHRRTNHQGHQTT